MTQKTTNNRSRTRWFMVLVPLLSAFATITAIELLLSLLAPAPFSIETNMYFAPDPYTGYALKPDSIGAFQDGIAARTNSHGHRDDEVTLSRPAGVFRVLALGDSFTVGANVPLDKAYPQVLERLLNDRSDTRVEVINTGVGGWNPFQYAQYYAHYGRQFQPNAVMVGFFVGNDSYKQQTDAQALRTAVLGRRVSREASRSGLIQARVFLYQHSNLFRYVTNRGQAVSWRLSRSDCSDFTPQYLQLQKRRLNNHRKQSRETIALAGNGLSQIKTIKALADRDAIPLLVALIPDETQVNQALREQIVAPDQASLYDFDMPQTMLKGMFTDAAIPVIDLLPAFRDDGRCLYMNDSHWTIEGHQLAASRLFDEIDARGLLPHLNIRGP